jgi:uncharacterized membrane protein YdjX (TVP38/TMEM64 family)
MKTSMKKIFFATLLVAAIVLAYLAGIHRYLTFENLVAHKAMLQEYVRGHYLLSLAGFVVLYVIVVALSIPGAVILSLSSGFLFGTALGVILNNAGATTGAICIFFITRHLIGNWLQTKYESQLSKFNNEFARNGSHYLLTLRFIPVFPFFLVNILAGLTKVPFKTFLWTTCLGILPGCIVYTFMGSQLSTIQSPKDIFSVNITIAFILLALFSLAPVIYNHCKKTK